MSTTEQPRQKAIKIAAVQTLREDETLCGWLYPDTPVPAALTDRLRIHEHDPGFEVSPAAQITVAGVASGGTWRGGAMSNSYIIECTTKSTDDYFERYTSTRFDDIHDRLAELFETSIAPGVMPVGPTSTTSPHELRGGTHDRVMVDRWRFETHWTTRWP